MILYPNPSWFLAIHLKFKEHISVHCVSRLVCAHADCLFLLVQQTLLVLALIEYAIIYNYSNKIYSKFPICGIFYIKSNYNVIKVKVVYIIILIRTSKTY